MVDNAGADVEATRSTVVTTTTVQAETTTTTGGAVVVTCNRGYICSWQGILKLIKLVCMVCMLIITVESFVRYRYYFSSNLVYCLILAIVGFLFELTLFTLYFLGVNFKWSVNPRPMVIALISCHSVMLALVYIAVILASAIDIVAYNAFAAIALAGYLLEIYFNVVWLQGGPELAALPCQCTCV